MVTLPAVAGVLVEPNCFTEADPEDCIANGKIKQIYIFDKIESPDLHKITWIATLLPSDKPFPKVVLNSGGGSIDPAIGIGRILRWRKASVETHDIFNPERTPMCFSACVLVAAGAVERNLDVIGIHSGYEKIRVRKEVYSTNPLPKETLDRVHDYYREMGIPEEIIEIETKTPPEKMEYFFFVLERPLERQKIHQLGFRMRGSDAVDVERLGKRDEAEKWSTGSLNQVAKTGDVESQYKLGREALDGKNGWGRNIDAALLWLNKAADQNHTGALHLLGVIYAHGTDGVEIDKSKAVSYYMRAAKLGYGGSQNNLAWAYYQGDGVDKNIYEAIYWATKATERGDYFSYGSLGAIRLDTDVFVRDDLETYKWLRLGTSLMPEGTAKQGDLKKLEEVKARMTPEQINQAEKLVKEWKPLEQSQSQMRDKDD